MKNHLSSKLLMSLAALGLCFHLSACTSSDEKTDGEEVAQDVEGLEGGGEAAAAPSSDESLLSDALPEDALGGEAGGSSASAHAADPTGAELDAADAAAGEVASEPPPLVSDPGMDSALDTATAESTPQAEPVPRESGSSMASMDSSSEPAPKKNIPLQKMATKPWQVGQDWFNGVYFARPGDTLQSIGRTIYGKNRTNLLKRGNPTYANRDPRPGDKVYYNSPKRPTDSEHMMNWYEDNGVQPEVYVAKGGDNIRSVSKKLLGYDGAWKETWSSNMNVESKGELEAGTEIRYWAAAPPATAVASDSMENTAPAPDMPAPPATDTAMNPPSMGDLPPPPAPDMAMNNPPAPDANMGMNDLPPPPPLPDAPPPPPPQAMNDIPPPPPMDNAPPPPPPAHQASHKAGEEEVTAMDQDTMMALGAVAIAAAGIAALLVVRRRRRQRDMDMQIDSTQVG